MSCADIHVKVAEINIRVTELDLLEQERTFSGHGSTITVNGMLHAVIEADRELIAYATARSYNLTYDVKDCTSGVEFAGASGLYPKPPKANGTYSYDLVFHYKLPPNRIGDTPYNLAKQPEALCFFVTAANMGPFYMRSNTVEVQMTESLKAKLRNYEAVSGKVNFNDHCKKGMCRPDYLM